MIVSTLTYAISKSTEGDIRKHLLSCDQRFSPPLSVRVCIGEYSNKIRDNATTHEAWDGNLLIGLVAAYRNIQERSLYITNVSVLPAWSGKGIATKLLSRCLEWAVSEAIENVSLEVSQENIPAMRLYENFGFKNRDSIGGGRATQYILQLSAPMRHKKELVE